MRRNSNSDVYTLMRHTIKAHKNNSKSKFRLDADITADGETVAKSHISKAKKTFTVIVTSPYLRARSTARVVAEYLNISKIVVDPMFGECLCNQREVKDNDFTPETLSYKPIVETNMDQFRLRMSEVIVLMRTKYGSDVLYITHGLNITTIAQICGSRPIVNPGQGWFYTIKIPATFNPLGISPVTFLVGSEVELDGNETKSVIVRVNLEIPPAYYGLLTQSSEINEKGVYYPPVVLHPGITEHFSVMMVNSCQDQVKLNMDDLLGTMKFTRICG